MEMAAMNASLAAITTTPRTTGACSISPSGTLTYFFHVIKGGGIVFLFILTNDASTVHESSILASFV